MHSTVRHKCIFILHAKPSLTSGTHYQQTEQLAEINTYSWGGETYLKSVNWDITSISLLGFVDLDCPVIFSFATHSCWSRTRGSDYPSRRFWNILGSSSTKTPRNACRYLCSIGLPVCIVLLFYVEGSREGMSERIHSQWTACRLGETPGS